MSVSKFLAATAMATLVSTMAYAQRGEKLPILAKYQGMVANDKKPDVKTEFLATEAEWKAVWAKINPDEKAPAVDFAKEFLLVSTHDAADPNRRNASVTKDDLGVVSLLEISTRIGFEPSDRTVFQFFKISRDGVTGVRRFDSAQNAFIVEKLPK